MICIAVVYQFQPGHADGALPLLRALAEATRGEPGCRMYHVHRSPSDPDRVFLYEQYEDEAALAAHREAPHFHEIAVGQIFPMLASRTPEIYTLID
jgi:autoinducer 2-degrading protein